jgi:hypothetical protein
MNQEEIRHFIADLEEDANVLQSLVTPEYLEKLFNPFHKSFSEEDKRIHVEIMKLDHEQRIQRKIRDITIQVILRLFLNKDMFQPILTLLSNVVTLLSNPKEYLDSIFSHFQCPFYKKVLLSLGIEHPEGILYENGKDQDRDMIQSGYRKIPRPVRESIKISPPVVAEPPSPTTLLSDQSLVDPRRLNHFTIGLTNPNVLLQETSSHKRSRDGRFHERKRVKLPNQNPNQ